MQEIAFVGLVKFKNFPEEHAPDLPSRHVTVRHAMRA